MTKSPMPNNTYLRTLLEVLDRATRQKDTELLSDLPKLSIGLSPEQQSAFYIVCTRAKEEIEGSSYHLHDDKNVSTSVTALQKAAYGNFVEAAHVLYTDMTSWRIGEDTLDSDIFKSELFDKNDRLVWESVRREVQSYKDDARYSEDIKAIETLRRHLQKYHGPLVPVQHYTYIKDSPTDEQAGFSFRVYTYNEALHVTGHPRYTNALKEAIQSSQSNEAPKVLQDLSLQDQSTLSLFHYELFS